MKVKVIIDVCVWSQDWFRNVLPVLNRDEHIIFVFAECGKYSNELDRFLKLKRFLNLQLQRKRAEIAPANDIEHFELFLSRNSGYRRCEACDDPHIFSLVRVKSVRFVFTSDERIETCRKTMQGIISKEFLNFRIIKDYAQFEQHRVSLGV